MENKTTRQQSLIADIYNQHATDVKLYFLRYTREVGMANAMQINFFDVIFSLNKICASIKT